MLFSMAIPVCRRVDVLKPLPHTNTNTRWWLQNFFISIPTWGRFPIFPHIFQMGWLKPPRYGNQKLAT